MNKTFKFKFPWYFTSHSKPERLRGYIFESKKENENFLKLKKMKGGNGKL